MKHTVAVLWTGGKDSCLALYRCKELGHQIKALATFVPDEGSEFKAHPQKLILQQAESLNLPIHFIPVKDPYRESYISGLSWLKSHLNISAVATGDIDLVSGLPNWIHECCAGISLEVLRPLWQEARDSLMDEILRRGITARITWINHPTIPKAWLNREIDASLLAEMKNHSRMYGIDLAGENGEYHTMVVGAVSLPG